MVDRVTLTETYKTGKGAGIIVAESGKVRGPYKVTVVVGDDRKGFKAPKTRKIAKLGEARAALRGKLGPLRKAKNPDEVIRLVLGDGEEARITETANPGPANLLSRSSASLANPLNKYYFQRGTGGLIRRKGKTYWVGSLDKARDEARRLSRMGKGVKVTILRVEPDGDQTAMGTVGSVGNPDQWGLPISSDFLKGDRVTYRGRTSVGYGEIMATVIGSSGQHVRIVTDNEEELDTLPENLRYHARRGREIKYPGRKRNPANMADADRLYEDFHGRPPTQTTKVVTRTKARTDLAELGPLTELKIHLLTGKRIKLPYEVDCDDQVMLCSSPDGRQLYFVGGDQTIDLRRLGMAGREWVKDSMVLGVLEMVTYRTEKGFDKFKLTDYYHELGEESGMQPLLMYDNINGLLSVAGGQYEVRPEGIVN